MTAPFRLELLTLHWMEGVPEQDDHCAHGTVFAQIGETVLSDAGMGNHTVSAAALYLLRTLAANHTPEQPIGDQMLPCCGFSFVPDYETQSVLVLGCPNGVDWSVEHEAGQVKLTAPKGPRVIIPFADYRCIVLRFADQVEEFYRISLPKATPSYAEDAEGYQLFWVEWHRLREQYRAL